MPRVAISLLLGSVRIGRRSDAVARYLHAQMTADPRFAPDFVDLADYRFEILSERPSGPASTPAGLEQFSRTLRQADGLIIVSPEYKGGLPGALKNAFDLLEPRILRRKPVALCTVSAGGFGGLQCLGQLRLTVLALGGVPLPESVAISRVQEIFEADGSLRPGASAPATAEFFDELFFYAGALKEPVPREAEFMETRV